MEYKHNFEYLTKKQNKSINEMWDEIKKLYDRGWYHGSGSRLLFSKMGHGKL